MNKEKHFTVYEQIAITLYRDQNLENTLGTLKRFHRLEQNLLDNNSLDYNFSKNTCIYEHNKRKIISTLPQNFSFNEQFPGSEVLHDHTTACKYVVRGLSFTEKGSIKYRHFLFFDTARVFFQSEIEGKFKSLYDALRRIEEEFNPRSRKQPINI